MNFPRTYSWFLEARMSRRNRNNQYSDEEAEEVHDEIEQDEGPMDQSEE